MKRKVLTVSEVNQMLIRKGYRNCETIRIDTENSWGADILAFEEYKDGHSVCALYKFHQHEDCPVGCGNLTRVATYRKLKVAEKYEIISIVAQLPKQENKN